MPKGQQQDPQADIDDIRATIRIKQQEIQTAQDEIANIQIQIGLIPQLLKARRDRLAKQDWTPVFTGNVSVVDRPERPIDSYQLGDQVAFTGFGSVIDYAIARITGISRNAYGATLNLTFVLPTPNRRLLSLEQSERGRRALGG